MPALLLSCAPRSPYYGPPVTEVPGAPTLPPDAGENPALGVPPPERISLQRTGLTLSARGHDAVAARGVLTFSASRLSPADLLRITAGALGLAPVLLDKPPETPLLDVPARMPIEQALELLDTVLASAGQELNFGDGVLYLRTSQGTGDIRLSRATVRAIRLNFIDNQTFASLAAALIPRDRLVLPAGDPSLVIYVGPAQGSGSLASIRALVDTFELRGTVATLVPLRRGNAGDIARQVRDVIGGGQSGLPKVIALPDRHALLVVAPHGFDVGGVLSLVRTLGAPTADEATPIRMFTPQHRTAADLVGLLRSIGAPRGQQRPGSLSGGFGPGMPVGAGGSGGGLAGTTGGGGGAPFSGALPVAGGASQDGTPQAGGVADGNPLLSGAPLVSVPPAPPRPATPAPEPDAAPQGGVMAGLLAETTVDPQTNRILFSGSASDFAVLRRALASLDSGGGQIMVEALIMQVALNDQLQYGVQYALSNARVFGTPISLTDNAGIAATEGLVFNLGGSSAQVIVHALDEVTNVTVISSPKILVVSGEPARFHFGASVPVLSASLTSSVGQGAALANQIQYRDTGVSLQVTPSAIDNATTDLNIQQVLSNISATTVAGVNSPVFDDREIETHVRLRFGDTIMLGGIIEHDRNDTDTGIPLLRRIPVIGSLFGLTSRTGARSEYVLLLTPRLYLDGSGGPRLGDATNLRFERLQEMWDRMHVDEAFPTSAADRLRQLRGP